MSYDTNKGFCLKFSDYVTDKLLHRLARRIGTEQAHLAAELDLQHCEIQQLQSTHREHTTVTFHVLKVTRHTRMHVGVLDFVDVSAT